MEELRAAGVDGILFDGSENSMSALVLRGCAVSQLRQVRQIALRQDDDLSIVADDGNTDIDCGFGPHPANADLRG